MSLSKKSVRVAILSLSALPIMSLAACGDGAGGGTQPSEWTNIPYTMERTAGTGVAFVRGAMLPPKETKTETIMEKPKPVAPAPAKVPPPPPEPITQGDKMFDKKQSK